MDAKLVIYIVTNGLESVLNHTKHITRLCEQSV
jgi:hypothetical protein